MSQSHFIRSLSDQTIRTHDCESAQVFDASSLYSAQELSVLGKHSGLTPSSNQLVLIHNHGR